MEKLDRESPNPWPLGEHHTTVPEEVKYPKAWPTATQLDVALTPSRRCQHITGGLCTLRGRRHQMEEDSFDFLVYPARICRLGIAGDDFQCQFDARLHGILPQAVSNNIRLQAADMIGCMHFRAHRVPLPAEARIMLVLQIAVPPIHRYCYYSPRNISLNRTR